MPEFHEISCQRVLAPTGMSQADYVINPYRGCQFGCAYCYAQWNKFASKKMRRWGEFVDIKINAPQILDQELKLNPQGVVMLGSTTEVYQPVENRYQITRQILEQLTHTSLSVLILTRSDLIIRDIDLLKKLRQILVCFTLNTLDDTVIRAFEKSSPSVDRRITALQALHDAEIPVYLHIGPVLPCLTDPRQIISRVSGLVNRVDFENLNLKMVSWEALEQILMRYFPDILPRYKEIYQNPQIYETYWNEQRSETLLLENSFPCKINIYFHPFDSFFPVFISEKNHYTK